MGSTRMVVVAVLCAVGCAGPDSLQVRPTSADDTGSGDDAGTTTAASGPGTSSDEGPPPTRPAPPPFELPEGCGDGLKVEGQYDCSVPHSIEWVRHAAWPEFPYDEMSHYRYVGYDIEGDGKDELLVVRKAGHMVALRYEGGELVLDESIPNEGTFYADVAEFETRWDWTGDGRADLTRLGQYGMVVMRPNLGGRALGAEQEIHPERQLTSEGPPHGVQGLAVPFDADGDGAPELLVSEIVGSPLSANPPNELVQFRREGKQWVEIGQRLEFRPCGWIGAHAYGDFDGDGVDDVAILDEPHVCNGYPEGPDPDWYRVGVFLADPNLGVLRFEGWFPAGGAIHSPRIWADDVDGDRHLDLIARINSPFTGLSVLLGRGDGTFEAGEPRDLTRLFPVNYPVGGRADLDGDRRQEWVVGSSYGQPWAIPPTIEVDGAGPMYTLNPPETGGSTSAVLWKGRAVADVNGDGIDDYLAKTGTGADVGWHGYFWMVSAP